MSVDPSVLAAMQTAVDASPENSALRVHLAELLLQAEEPAKAFQQAKIILEDMPDHIQALKVALQANQALGDATRAASYDRVLRGLGMNTGKILIDSGGFGETEEPTQEPELEPIDLAGRVTLADVKGLSAVKERLELAFLGPLRNPELKALFKKSLRGGLLLYGPPGCGKTFIARALAGELSAQFISVSLTDVVNMYIGQSEKNLHELFESARRIKPVVIFIDEIDALGRKRTLTREHAGRNLVNQLLTEMDGFDATNDGVYIVGATNHPWDVDSALRRPGRFDRTVLVLPPDAEARQAIMVSALEGRPVGSMDPRWVACQTEGFSGADLVHLADSAAELALADSIKKGKARAIEMSDIKQALKGIKPSTQVWIESAKNFVLFANEGGEYDDLAAYLRPRKML